MSTTTAESSMATMTKVSFISEAEYGCEHLATILSQDDAGEKFRNAFLKAQTPSRSLASETNGVSSSTAKKAASLNSLKPAYTCLDCFEKHSNGGRKVHSDETKHNFYMESRTGALFCQECHDLVYDHDLDRLRAVAYGFPRAEPKKRTFSESSSEETYIKSNASKKPCATEGVRGLFNLGQTCYLNVVLQTLLHDPLLNTYFLGNGHQVHECTIDDCILCATAEAFTDFNKSENSEGFAALSLLLATWKHSTTLAGYAQQDAHEFYQFLVDRLHLATEGYYDSAEGKCACFFHKAFFGKIRSSVTCDKCGNVTQTEDPMLDLSLDVQIQAKKRHMAAGRRDSLSAPPTLSGCLESFTSSENLMADSYNCKSCGDTPQKATKQLRIKRLPAILCMQLKRFEHTLTVSEKLEGRIDFPLSLNMLPYTTKAKQRRAKMDQSRYTYDLASAVVHRGKLDAGHYYAYCRQGDQWFLFNDDQVTAATEADVLSADAYLLFYTLRSLSVAR